MNVRQLPEYWTELQLDPAEMRMVADMALEYYHREHRAQHPEDRMRRLCEQLFEAAQVASGKPPD